MLLSLGVVYTVYTLEKMIFRKFENKILLLEKQNYIRFIVLLYKKYKNQSVYAQNTFACFKHACNADNLITYVIFLLK